MSTDQQVPYTVQDPLRIPQQRYFDREFFELENRKLWERAWQMACRLEDIPEPNDFMEYEISDQSIFVVRQPDMTVKAFYNVCPHRGTKLADGCGTFSGAQITCPFHGWRWNTEGSVSFIYGKEGFTPESTRVEDLQLRECNSGIWGGLVWISLDPEAEPLESALSPVAKLLEDVGIQNWRVMWWQETILDCNWKMAQEAFMEGWHVMRTHPQLTMGAGESARPDFQQHKTYEKGHSSFQYPDVETDLASFEGYLEAVRLVSKGMGDGIALERNYQLIEGLRNKVTEGDRIRDAIKREMRSYNDGAGIPMPEGIENNPFWWGSEVFIFPNLTFLPRWENAVCYRSRPYDNNPEKCRFEVWSLTSYPESRPVTRPTLNGTFNKNDDQHWPLIPMQDFSNLERQQTGIHAKGFEGMRLATEWESGISNMHQELDRRLQKKSSHGG